MVIGYGLNHPVAFVILPTDDCSGVTNICAIQLVVDHVATDDSGARIG